VAEAGALAAFLASATAAAVLWGRSLWYLGERSRAFRRCVLFTLGFTRRTSAEVAALALSAAYYALGLLAALSFASAFQLKVSVLVSWSAAHLGLAVLGVVGEISLASLLVALCCWALGQRGSERLAEVREIPWMKGIRELPPAAVPVAAALGGLVEEVLFRGVLLRILTDRLHVDPWWAVAIAGALFCLEQLVQVQTAFQAMVIASSCVAISLVGGLLVVLTGSVVPAVLSHASFVVFFMLRSDAAPARWQPTGEEVASA
jgi:membrane protease YdiL (CAAX protease family)